MEITGIEPNPVKRGSELTITGSGFGASKGAGYVRINSNYQDIVSWSDTEIVIAARSGSGILYVVNDSNETDSVEIRVKSYSSSTGPGINVHIQLSGI
jgi:hypothetical protein